MSGEIAPSGEPAGPAGPAPTAASAPTTAAAASAPAPASASAPGLRASHADRDRVVDVLRIAAGDGLLTSDELDERVEAALSARTLGELAPLTADLPAVSTSAGTTVGEVKDLVRIEGVHSGAVVREGRWVVPRRMEIAVMWCKVTLDFTDAVITQDTLRIDGEMAGKTLVLITRPGIVVDTGGLQLVHAKVIHRRGARPGPGAPVTLRIELAGHKTHGRVVIRPARRTFTQWLLRRRPDATA
ncbi:DUF1707 domain-containing protein [Streptomyces sp. TRM66268-LWL]|uniref:DUF1707 domain-containing protein n=1 Tax=Streptomyces polyasparticus TaxID=2767826 RepID=A0ABR7S6R1_9ACTN|nr:DUF1707 domain-containing protein [Streptomyces polyasparticus]MBC9711140.1 DUF1707 domain-containing protein [Streptomyces polyasparticus]